MAVKLYEEPDHGPSTLIALVVIILLLLLTSKCHAQQKAAIDTMVCKVECIKQIVQQPSSNGKTVKYMAVYVDKSAGFSEIIPVSKSVVDYINVCKNSLLSQHLALD